MRVLLAALSLAVAATSTRAAPSDVGGLAGAIDNAAQAASLQVRALSVSTLPLCLAVATRLLG